MQTRTCSRIILAVGSLLALSGCVAYPAQPYGYGYGEGGGYYAPAPPVVVVPPPYYGGYGGYGWGGGRHWR